MTGDRRLTKEELQAFINGHVFLNEILDKGGEPSLFDIAFIELAADLNAQRMIIIDLGERIVKLESRAQALPSYEDSHGLLFDR